MARLQEPEGLGEGGFADDIEGEVVDPFVEVDAPSGVELDETLELVAEERDAFIDVSFSLDDVAERVAYGDVPGPPNHFLVVCLGHCIDIA